MSQLGIEAGEGWYILKDAGAIVEFTGGTRNDNLHAEENASSSGAIRVAKWGQDNLKPQNMLKLFYGNHIKPQLIYTSRDFTLGSRVGVFKRIIEAEKMRIVPVLDNQIQDFMEMIDMDNYMRSAAYNLEFSHNAFTSFSLDARTKKIAEVLSWDCTDTRAAQMQGRERRPSQYYLHPDWRNWKASEVSVYHAYDRANPTRFGDFMFQGRDWLPGQPYYDVPPSWGSEKWTEVSNLIPRFHISGLKNGYNIKYHIRIPVSYFDQFKDQKEKEKEEARVMTVMNEMLSGVDNAQKTFVSKFATDTQTGKPLPGWSIEPIENNMADDAYSKINEQANIAHASSHGIDPSLAGIDTGSKLGGSGSEKRISYQLHIALRTPNKRKILLEPFNNIAKKIEGWNPEHFLGFEDVDITTLDQNPTGKQKVVNPSM